MVGFGCLDIGHVVSRVLGVFWVFAGCSTGCDFGWAIGVPGFVWLATGGTFDSVCALCASAAIGDGAWVGFGAVLFSTDATSRVGVFAHSSGMAEFVAFATLGA